MTAEAVGPDDRTTVSAIVEFSQSVDDQLEIARLAESNPSLLALLHEVSLLDQSYPGAAVLLQPIRDTNERIVCVPAVQLGPTWSPPQVSALLVCTGWPEQRPLLLLHENLRQNGSIPTAAASRYILGHSWVQFSFNAPYLASSPSLVSVVRGWLRRFDGRP